MGFLTRKEQDWLGIPVLPGALPVIGHLHRMYDNPITFVKAATAAVGPLFWAKFVPREWALVVCGKEVLQLFKRPTLLCDGYRTLLPEIFGESMLTKAGARHAHLRSAMNPLFSPRGLTENSSIAMAGQIIADRVEAWVRRGEVDILSEAQKLTLEVVFRLMGLLPQELPEYYRQFRELLMSVVQLPVNLPGFPLYRGRKARKWLDEHILAILQDARRGARSGGLLARLLDARDESGTPLSDQELVDNLRLLAFAGHDTTASTIAWTVVTLARHPEHWDRLVEEAQRVDVELSSPQALRSFPFAEALFRESLRMYPPTALVPRITTEPLSLYGHEIPAGVALSLFICSLVRDPETFKDPDRYDPSRWLDRPTPPGPAEIVNFGGGPHFCLGYHLAVAEGVLAAVALARSLGKRGLRPRLAGDSTPKFLLFGHPKPRPRIRFVARDTPHGR